MKRRSTDRVYKSPYPPTHPSTTYSTCTPAYMAYYRQYCKTQGCSATQCDVPAEAPFVPSKLVGWLSR